MQLSAIRKLWFEGVLAMFGSTIVRTLCILFLGAAMGDSSCAIDRPLNVETLDAATRGLLVERNRVDAFVTTVDDKTRMAVEKFLAVSPSGDDLARNRIVGPGNVSPYIVQATVPVGAPISVFYFDSTVVFLSTASKGQTHIAYESLFVIVYIPRDVARGTGFVKRVMNIVHSVSQSY
jgi:hypothetical protein